MGAGGNCYRYNGKEFSEELGLYDYGARWYDPAVGRWGQIDPLAETMSSWSPYNSNFNNPVRFVDMTGLSPNPYGLNSSTNSTQQDKDESQREISANQSPATLDVLLYNDPSANTRLTTSNLISFVDQTSSILSLNGISENVNYRLIDDLSDAPWTAWHGDRTLFLALTNNAFSGRKQGQSTLIPSGQGVAFYSIPNDNTYFHSGLDVNKFRVGSGSHVNNPSTRGWWKSEINHMAYSGAHELLHQLDIFSRNAFPGQMSSYPHDGHYRNSTNILNAGGAYSKRRDKGVGDSYLRLPVSVKHRILEYLNNR